MSDLKKKLYKELELRNSINVEGINVDPAIFKHLDFDVYAKQIHGMFERDRETHAGIDFPTGFHSQEGFRAGFKWDRSSPYSIQYENGKYYLLFRGDELFEIEFSKRPNSKYHYSKASDGTWLNRIASFNKGAGTLFVTYSNECSLKDKGLDCKFCNINATKNTYSEQDGIKWKNSKQIGEAAAAGYAEGGRHITISGGFIPERREVDYYVDVAESIKEHTGLEDFNGTAVIGAPLDLGVIDRYKEVGYRTMAMNLEIWNKNIYKAICPGKDAQCGGWDHWVKALEYAAQVFGFGRVRSNIVGGIETKESTLEGVEYLASKGVVATVSAWNPNPGSQLQGHRSPEPAWHFDMAKKVATIHRKAGFTFEQLYDCTPSPGSLVHEIYKIEDELLPVFRKPAVAAAYLN